MSIFQSLSRRQQSLFSLLQLLFLLGFFSTLSAQTITRKQIHNNAKPFTTYTFTASSSNIHANVSCSGVGNENTPTWVHVGSNSPGMAYCWGGFSSLSSFTAGLTNGKSAGDNDCSTSGDCCESCALGVDCSGFVSHAWGLSTKYSTGTLPNISTAYSSASQVLEGDIFNLAGSHVRLVDTNYANGNFLLMESSAVDWKVSYRSYTASQLTSYTPRWYVHVDTILPPCNHYYATIPYFTSFENTWITDSCTSGPQRQPDKYWKTSIGGTSPGGNDYWHRDDYTGGDWTSPASGQYTPLASNGSYSARFHNSPATGGSTGMFDLYLNLSATGTKTIKFDYLHAEASPAPFAFNVMLSTDGGNTFPTTLLTITSAQVSAWTTQTITTSASSATCVLRFIATDKGSVDVGIDNLSVGFNTVTGVQTFASTEGFNVFPNPTDGTALHVTLPEEHISSADVMIYDMLGSRILLKQVAVDSHSFSLQLDKGQLAAGVYLLVVQAADKKYTKRIIVN